MGALLLSLAPLTSATEVKPSRLVDAKELPKQVNELSSRLAMGKREVDPFGRLQDLNQPVPISGLGDGPGIKPKPTPLEKIVETIPVVAVSPKQGRIMVGARPWVIGQVKKVPYRGRKYDIALTRVTVSDLDFRNVKNGDTATLKFKGAIEDPKQPDPW